MLAAVENNHEQCVRLSLELGATDLEKASYLAACHGYENIIRLMVDRPSLSTTESGFKTLSLNRAMIEASRRGYLSIVKSMLERRAGSIDLAMVVAAREDMRKSFS